MEKESTERERLIANAALSLLAASDFLRLAANPGEVEDFDPAEVWDKIYVALIFKKISLAPLLVKSG